MPGLSKPTDAYGSADVFAGSYTDEQWDEIVDAHVDRATGAPFWSSATSRRSKRISIPLYGTEASPTVEAFAV